MPWCDDCAKYWAPSTMTPAGRCPTCDRELDAAGLARDDQGAERAPWHFKVLVVALVVYLAWRFFQIFFG